MIYWLRTCVTNKKLISLSMKRNIYDVVEDFVELVDSPAKVAQTVINCYFEDQVANGGLPPDTDQIKDLQCLVNFLLELEQLKQKE